MYIKLLLLFLAVLFWWLSQQIICLHLPLFIVFYSITPTLTNPPSLHPYSFFFCLPLLIYYIESSMFNQGFYKIWRLKHVGIMGINFVQSSRRPAWFCGYNLCSTLFNIGSKLKLTSVYFLLFPFVYFYFSHITSFALLTLFNFLKIFSCHTIHNVIYARCKQFHTLISSICWDFFYSYQCFHHFQELSIISSIFFSVFSFQWLWLNIFSLLSSPRFPFFLSSLGLFHCNNTREVQKTPRLLLFLSSFFSLLFFPLPVALIHFSVFLVL